MITGYIETDEDVQRRLDKESKPIAPKEYGCHEDVRFTIPRGTPYTLKFDLKDFSGWMRATAGHWWYSRLKNGDKAFFGIKKHPDDSDYIYTRIVTVDWTFEHNQYGVLVNMELGDMTSHGSFTITLSENDTDIEPGVYYYSIAAFISDKKTGDSRNYEYKEPCFVEISPPVPFRIRPMMAKLADMYDYYVRLIADTDEKIAELEAKTQTAAIEADIQALKRLKLNYQVAKDKIQKKINGGG